VLDQFYDSLLFVFPYLYCVVISGAGTAVVCRRREKIDLRMPLFFALDSDFGLDDDVMFLPSDDPSMLHDFDLPFDTGDPDDDTDDARWGRNHLWFNASFTDNRKQGFHSNNEEMKSFASSLTAGDCDDDDFEDDFDDGSGNSNGDPPHTIDLVSAWSLPTNGGRPNSNVYATAPTDHMSAILGSSDIIRRFITSGAAYNTVPTRLPALSLLWFDAEPDALPADPVAMVPLSNRNANPKSISLMLGRSSSLKSFSMMFSGLMSRWTTPITSWQ